MTSDLLVRSHCQGHVYITVIEHGGRAEAWGIQVLIDILEIHKNALIRASTRKEERNVAERAGKRFAAWAADGMLEVTA